MIPCDLKMQPQLLLYGSTGFLGEAIARLAVQQSLPFVIAGRDGNKVKRQAVEWGVEHRVFNLDDSAAMDQALKGVTAVLHCAGPYLFTSKPMVGGCLRSGVHYMDLTGEIPVYEAIAARDAEAKSQGVMLLPGVGFDVVPTDCLAVHLKQRLPSASRLTLAFQVDGPAGLPPGTQRTAIELIPFGNRVRRNGRVETPEWGTRSRMIDFGRGPVEARRLPWGDVFTAYYSTGIPNIEDYAVLPQRTRRQLALVEYTRPLFRLGIMRRLFKLTVKPGPTVDEQARTVTHVWGEVEDDQGNKATARLHGPEAGVVWTSRAALATAKKALAGEVLAGFQTPALAYGPDLVMECEGVTREDLN